MVLYHQGETYLLIAKQSCIKVSHIVQLQLSQRATFVLAVEQLGL